jgi:hypothetical protein
LTKPPKSKARKTPYLGGFFMGYSFGWEGGKKGREREGGREGGRESHHTPNPKKTESP